MLSIIIVNYNVKYFLEQCLYSLRRSIEDILGAEIIVLDNQSTDASIEYLSGRFPEVRFIRNEQNLGFATACNKGFHLAKGDYILFLNPDTLVGEETLTTCLQFFKQHPKAGAIGVKMIDGSGKFLKESKRAFPRPLTSLYKLFGLAKLFPNSPIFSRYYLGHLSADKNSEVDVLAGAFMMIRRNVLKKTGAFDEDFFMYGEDIDLSYRIQKQGYKNYYLADATIIHFKGESTKHGSLNYVRMFYAAMSIFVKKHYGGNQASIFNFFLHLAIWVRAFISAGAKFIRWIGLPFIDALLIFFSFWATKDFWARFIKPETIYPSHLLWIAFPVYTLVYLLVAYYAGLYNKFYQRAHLLRSMLTATLMLLAGYALLPEKFRFSRGIILFGALLAFVLISVLRWILVKGNILQRKKTQTTKPYLLIAASIPEFEQISEFLKKQKGNDQIIGRISVSEDREHSVADLDNVGKLSAALGAQELLFYMGQLSYQRVINFISAQKLALRLRFHAQDSSSIIGSDTDTDVGEAIAHETDFNLAMPNQRRLKRLVDLLAACLMIFFFPLVFLFVIHPIKCLKNCLEVLGGKKTWIGYIHVNSSLPPLRDGVLTVSGKKHNTINLPDDNIMTIDYWYAKNYEPMQDLRLIVKNYKHLGT